MQNKRNVATWLGAVLGVLAALVLNATFAHAAESNWVTEEFHQTYSLTSDGRVSLNNINGAAHISAWDRNEVKVDAVKRADDQDGLIPFPFRRNIGHKKTPIVIITTQAWNTVSPSRVMRGSTTFS
jgi:hypothetical protein